MARQRINDMLATEATVMQTAMASIVSKKGGGFFKDTLKKLRGGR